jgi:hypothetical protein
MTAGSAQGTATVASNRSVEHVLAQADNPDKFCIALAKLFAVRPKEVALLSLDKLLLKFVYPDELKTVGTIPVSSSSAIAAHTATTKRFEIFNNFPLVKHAQIFEVVKLESVEDADVKEHTEQPAIQKLMSAPILSAQSKTLGVLQVCRKGFSLTSSGPDFTEGDLSQLKLAAAIAAKKDFMAAAPRR